MSDIERIKRMLRPKSVKTISRAKDFLSSGITLIDLACSGKIGRAFKKGGFYYFVGDSSSGKTFMLLTVLAEACLRPDFKKYTLIYDDVEAGALMDIGHFFGTSLLKRLQAPSKEGSSTTTDDFYMNLDTAISNGPCIYILDSMDALMSLGEDAKFAKKKAAKGTNKEVKSDLGLGKAKDNSMNLRRAISKMKKNGSILFIVSQTRDNLAFGFEKQTRAGGRALKFYATLELWLSVRQRIQKRVKGKERQIGIISKIKIKKNRVQGKERDVQFHIYHSVGLDDIGSSVQWLIDEKYFKGTKENLKAPDFDFVGSQEDLIQHIQEQKAERELALIVKSVWDDIEKQCTVKRRNRYASEVE